MSLEVGFVVLGAIAFFASTVTGALGYGFSSLTVPVSLLFFASRVLNPALVLVELAINLYALLLNRQAIGRVWPRVAPLVLGLLPGVALGSWLLSSVSPDWMKLVTFVVLLPMILFQAAGVRWPIRRERAVGVPFGAGVGLLYSITTISGPPLALLFNNQGMAKADFKVALAITRTAESVFTVIAYAWFGMFTVEATGLLPWILPGVLVGVPFGHWLIRRLDAETFRRVCMSFDAWVVAFGLSRMLQSLDLLDGAPAYSVLAVTIVLDAVLLTRFFAARHTASPARSDRALEAAL